ncbi:MAG: methionine--tRNA ligase subunit beta [Anaerococcus sp.]|nr:methionine--tRNA ligase subunit beta [Anaerococcus sp.]
MKPIGKNSEENTESAPVKTIEETNEVVDFTGVETEEFYEDVDFDSFSKSDFRVVKVTDCQEVPKSNKLLKFTLDDGTDTPRTILSGIKKHYNPEELIGKNLVAIVNLPPRSMMGEESQGMILSAVHNQNGEEKLNVLMVGNNIPAGAKLY